MKKSIVLILSLITLTIVQVLAQDVYKSKSGKIVYQYEFDNTKSTYTLLFDDYGKKQVIDIVNLDSKSERVKTIITPEAFLIVNYEDKQVMKIPVDDSNEEMKNSAGGGMDLGAIVAEVSGNEHSRAGTELVAGKNCTVYQINDGAGNKGKYWIHNGYLFKADFVGEDGERAYMQVKEFKLDEPISAENFKYPSNFEMNDMTQMMQQMKQLQQMYGIPDGE